MTAPGSVRALNALAWLQIASVVLFTAYALYAAAVVPAGGTAAGFREGFVRGAGYDPASFGVRQAGHLFGTFVPTLVLASLVLFFIRSRRLTGVRVCTTLAFLFALGSGVPWIPLLMALLAFAPATRDYLRGGAEESPIPAQSAAR